MLTATYSLVAIAAEQDKARRLLQRLQHFVEASWKGLQSIDFGFLEAGCERMMQLEQFLQSRKLVRHVLPALREAGREAELIVGELESLIGRAGKTLSSVANRLVPRPEMGRIEVSQLCESMEVYCRHVHARLQMEEQILLPLARRVLSVEDWFRLAAAFLSNESTSERRTAGTGRERGELAPVRLVRRQA